MSALTTFPAVFEVTIPMRLRARARGMHPRSAWSQHVPTFNPRGYCSCGTRTPRKEGAR
jgi:hypothetical protein